MAVCLPGCRLRSGWGCGPLLQAIALLLCSAQLRKCGACLPAIKPDPVAPQAPPDPTHRCIPVVLMDNVSVPFEHLLDTAAFSMRVPSADVEKLPEILEAVPQSRREEMQRSLARVWQRWARLAGRLAGWLQGAAAAAAVGTCVLQRRLTVLLPPAGLPARKQVYLQQLPPLHQASQEVTGKARTSEWQRRGQRPAVAAGHRPRFRPCGRRCFPNNHVLASQSNRCNTENKHRCNTVKKRRVKIP